jgi:hypothetical protein
VKKLILFSLLFISKNIFAAPTITTVNGVSNFLPLSGSVPAAIYGGMAGTCPSPSTSATCNTCVDTNTPIRACNPKSINPSLVVTVGFTSAVAITNGTIELRTSTTGATGGTVLKQTTITLAAGGSGSISTTWGEICAADASMNNNSNCIGSAANIKSFDAGRTLALGIDEGTNGLDPAEYATIPIFYQYVDATSAANTQTYLTTCDGSSKGSCGFTLKPGDEKLYVDGFFTAGTAGSAPTQDPNMPAWLGVAFFSSNATGVTPVTISNSHDPVIKLYDANFGLTDSKIDGLENDVKTCVVMGNINKAYNIYYYTTTAADATKMCATPSQVVGLLEDKHCFISTAAFGSDMAPEVQMFREFRNRFLLTNSLGKDFVKSYYKFGPIAADIISKNETLRTVTRGALYPLLGFSYLALNYGFAAALLALLASLILLNAVIKTVFRHKKVLAVFIILISFNLKAETTSSSRQVQHPGAADGLVRIDKDGNYIYNVKNELTNKSSRIYFGQASNPDVSIEITNKAGVTNNYNFDDFYAGSSKVLIGYDYEWYPWAQKTKLGIQTDVAFMYADGHGRLIAGTPTDPNPVSEEKFSFVTLPLSLGAIYRFQYKDAQLFVPYVSGGGTYVVLAEKREDKSTPNFTGGFGFYGTGGLLINLSALDRETSYELNSEYGIGNMWLSLEYKTVDVKSDSFAFSSQFFNAGIAFDF